VIGTAGGKEKCDWLVMAAHFDAAIDYKSEDIGARLSELCPNGIDVFFDNVGGTVLNEVLARINLSARIVLCGAISRYNEATPPPGPANYFDLTAKRGRMEGFIILDYAARIPEAVAALGQWQKEGKLVQKEDIAVGLENAPRTLMRLFTGENFGKQLLKIADPRQRRLRLRRRPPDLIGRHRFGLQDIGDALDIVEPHHRHLRLRQWRVGRDRDDAIIVGIKKRLADRGAEDFELRMGVALKTLDDHQIDRGELRQDFGERQLGCLTQLVNDRPAPARGDCDLARAGLAVQPRILARMVDVEVMVGVLDGRDLEAAPDQRRNDPRDQRRLAGSAPAGKADDAHRCCIGRDHGRL